MGNFVSKLIKIANLLDSENKFVEADIVNDVLVRLGQGAVKPLPRKMPTIQSTVPLTKKPPTPQSAVTPATSPAPQQWTPESTLALGQELATGTIGASPQPVATVPIQKEEGFYQSVPPIAGSTPTTWEQGTGQKFITGLGTGAGQVPVQLTPTERQYYGTLKDNLYRNQPANQAVKDYYAGDDWVEPNKYQNWAYDAAKFYDTKLNPMIENKNISDDDIRIEARKYVRGNSRDFQTAYLEELEKRINNRPSGIAISDSGQKKTLEDTQAGQGKPPLSSPSSIRSLFDNSIMSINSDGTIDEKSLWKQFVGWDAIAVQKYLNMMQNQKNIKFSDWFIGQMRNNKVNIRNKTPQETAKMQAIYNNIEKRQPWLFE